MSVYKLNLLRASAILSLLNKVSWEHGLTEQISIKSIKVYSSLKQFIWPPTMFDLHQIIEILSGALLVHVSLQYFAINFSASNTILQKY